MLVLHCQLAPVVNNTTPEVFFVPQPFPFNLSYLQTIKVFVSELGIQSITFVKGTLILGKMIDWIKVVWTALTIVFSFFLFLFQTALIQSKMFE